MIDKRLNFRGGGIKTLGKQTRTKVHKSYQV
jgi:hypothetical protein